ILVCFNYILKQTYRKVYSIAFSAIVCALFVGLMWPYAIEQSKSQISDWLANSALMLDIAVILTLEVAVQMAFCVLSAHIQTSGKVKPITIWVYRVLRWFPGVLIFPVLFSLLVSAIFALPGVSFSLIAWVLAAIVFIVIPLAAWGVKWLLPEKEIRLELLFLSNALIAILGVIATVNGQTAVAGISDVDWKALGGVVSLLTCGLALGIIAYRIKLKRITKNR
ncbi:MAG: hypothetical protein E7065_10835, partial [Lentimicrobiaceae bacterium]|nr:hypothetical protein [Lentimicrobiaceae bacterium]